MLLSLDKVPRGHNILVSFFAWILLAGFVIMPGSFTGAKGAGAGVGPANGQSVSLPIGGGGGGGGKNAGKISLTPANTAAMVVGFICVVAGTFGSAWLGLRWRRNGVWLLNKLYMPLILHALAGVLTTLTSVYTQQAGEWSTQALVAVIVEASIFGLSVVLFFVYNYRLLRQLRAGYVEETEYGRERKDKRKEKKRRRRKVGLWARLRRGRKKRPMATGSMV